MTLKVELSNSTAPGESAAKCYDITNFGSRISLVVADAALVVLGFFGAIGVHRIAEHVAPDWFTSLKMGTTAMIIYALLATSWIILMVHEGIYRDDFSSLDPTERQVKALSTGLILFALFSLTVHGSNWSSRLVLIVWYVLNLFSLSLMRPLIVRTVTRLNPRRPLLFVGDVDRLNVLLPSLHARGFEISTGENSPSAGSSSVLVGLRTLDDWNSEKIASYESRFRDLAIVPLDSELNLLGAHPVIIGGLQLYALSHPLDRPLNRFLKRVMDISVSLGLLLVGLPIALIMAIIIKVDSPGPIFYFQMRLGRAGKPFRMCKFRSMAVDAELRLRRLLEQDSQLRVEYEATYKLKNDPRITKIGRFLRRTSLDELPQLWNVLRGEMSLVGPRPIVNSEIALYGPAYAIMSSIKPGMTGLWQVSGRSDTSYDARRSFDVSYVRRWSFWLDVAIIIRTTQEMLFPNAY